MRETTNNIEITSQQLDIALGMQEDLLIVPDTTLLETKLPLQAFDEYVSMAYEQTRR